MRQKINRAFTLIELMIVVAIIVFLAAVASPQYFKYQAKARQAEVAVILGSLHTAQQAFFAQHGYYSNELSGPNGIGWKPEGYRGGGKEENFYYTYGFNVPNGQEGIHFFTGKLGTPPAGLTGASASQNTFVAGAVGDVSGKNVFDVWRIDESRKIENIQNGID